MKILLTHTQFIVHVSRDLSHRDMPGNTLCQMPLTLPRIIGNHHDAIPVVSGSPFVVKKTHIVEKYLY